MRLKELDERIDRGARASHIRRGFMIHNPTRVECHQRGEHAQHVGPPDGLEARDDADATAGSDGVRTELSECDVGLDPGKIDGAVIGDQLQREYRVLFPNRGKQRAGEK